MPTIFLHCGAPKTGTSYLQVLFARYSEELRKNGLIYPENTFTKAARAGKASSGNGVQMANFLKPDLPHRISDKDAFLGEFEKELIAARGANLLYSSEYLSFPNSERTNRLKDVIRRYQYDVRIIYLVRDYAAAAYSTYSQLVKRSGEHRDFSTFLSDWRPPYDRQIELINASFGPESLSVYNYEEHKKNLAELFFGTVLGYRVNVEEIGTVNRSLSKKEIELLRLFNRYSEGNAAAAGSFVGDALMALPPIGNEVFLPSEEDVRFLEDRFGASLDRLNRVVTGRKVKISTGFRDDSEAIELSEFERFSMAVLARLVQRAVQ